MNINIEPLYEIISKNKNNINKLFFNTKNKIKTEKKTIIKETSFFLQNEINNNKSIEKIYDFYNYYITISDINPLKLDDINKNINLHKDFNININKKYFLLEYNCIDDNMTCFNIFFKNIRYPKYFIFHIIDSYSYLLKSIHLLNKNDIYHFNISNNSILFNNIHLKPFLSSFFIAFNKAELINNLQNDTKYTFLKNIVNNCNNYSLKPIEIHVLYFILNNNLNTLSYSNIEEIIQNYIQNQEFFILFSKKYKDEYYEECLDYLKNYINKSINYIIFDIINYIDLSDSFSLSIMYLYLIGNTIRYLSLKNTILNKIIIFLNKSICGNPKKRENIKNNIKNLNNCLDCENNYDFIKKINIDNFDILLNSL